MEQNTYRFVDENLLCGLHVKIDENGTSIQSPGVVHFTKTSANFSRRLEFFSSDHAWLLKQGVIKMAVSRSSECKESRLDKANLKLERIIGSPTEKVLLKQFAFIIGIGLITLSIFGFHSIEKR